MSYSFGQLKGGGKMILVLQQPGKPNSVSSPQVESQEWVESQEKWSSPACWKTVSSRPWVCKAKVSYHAWFKDFKWSSHLRLNLRGLLGTIRRPAFSLKGGSDLNSFWGTVGPVSSRQRLALRTASRRVCPLPLHGEGAGGQGRG